MKNKNYWEKVYDGKLDNNKFRQFSEEELDKILARFPHVKDAYDLGCGRGELLIQLHKRGINAHGIEISEAVKNHAYKKVKDFIKVGDLQKKQNFPYAVDIIFLKFVLAFIKDTNFLRKLKPFIKQGIVILSPVGEKEHCVSLGKLKAFFEGFEAEEEVWYRGDGVRLSLFILK